MPDDLESLVRESLNAVDRSRRLATITTWALFLIMVLTLGYLFANWRSDRAGEAKLLWVASAGQMAFMGLCVALLAGHVTRMTKAVLRAVELAQRKE